MKIISFGEHYQIYGNDLKTYDKLPPATYKIQFNQFQGFSLVKIEDFESVESKIYGNHKEKIEKVLKSYNAINRSLGVILSGNKGMGKSLFTQLLAQESIKNGLPVIMVAKAYNGIADFIDKIDQECLVLFDEFEKVFPIEKNDSGDTQNDLLGLFDGTSQKKRLYAITVNNLNKVSEFVVSRTGRFHYHIRFDYPDASEIETYLQDKLDEQYYGEIKKVVAFANRVQLNYDSLRAIAFELNLGYSFNSAISDLNILTTDMQRYDVLVTFTNGKTQEISNQGLNLFKEEIIVGGYTKDGDWFTVEFNMSNVKSTEKEMYIEGKYVELDIDLDEDSKHYTKDDKVANVLITHHIPKGVNYRLDV